LEEKEQVAAAAEVLRGEVIERDDKSSREKRSATRDLW
jgi:hypothetical protein